MNLIGLVKQYNIKRKLPDLVQAYTNTMDNIRYLEGTIARKTSAHSKWTNNISKALHSNIDDNSKRIVERRIHTKENEFNDEIFNLTVQLQKAESALATIVDDIKSYEDNVFKYQSYLPYNIGRTRESMPQISQDNIFEYINHFSDKAKAKIITMPVKKLKPSQQDISDVKVMNLLFDSGYEGRTYIISKDNYLVDGHHAWAAQLEIDEECQVRCIKVNLPIKQLLKRSNQLKITTKVNVDDANKALLVEGIQNLQLPQQIAVSSEPTMTGDQLKSLLIDHISKSNGHAKTPSHVFSIDEYNEMIRDRDDDELEVINNAVQHKNVVVKGVSYDFYVAY